MLRRQKKKARSCSRTSGRPLNGSEWDMTWAHCLRRLPRRRRPSFQEEAICREAMAQAAPQPDEEVEKFRGEMAPAPTPLGEKERGNPRWRGAVWGPRRTPTRFPGTGTMTAPPILRWRGCGAIREWWSCSSKFLSMVASVRWGSGVPPVMKFWTGRPWRPSGRGDSNRGERRGGP